MAFDYDKKWSEIQAKFKSVNETKPLKDFKKDLKRGQDAEHIFAMKYQHCITRLDGRGADFEIDKTGETIELKTDFYGEHKTANFFMERYSYDDKVGGPWQALSKSVTYFVYQFDGGSSYIFNTAQLVRKLDKLTKDMELVCVRNKNHVTKGFKVERSLLDSIRLHPEDIGLYEKKGKK